MRRLPVRRWAPGTVLFIALLATSARDLAEDPRPASAEPPLEFTLEIDGQRVPITTEAPVKLRIGDREVTARLIPRPDRAFKARGISFRYPRQHGYAVDDSTPGVIQWTLDGNDNVLIVKPGRQACPDGSWPG